MGGQLIRKGQHAQLRADPRRDLYKNDHTARPMAFPALLRRRGAGYHRPAGSVEPRHRFDILPDPSRSARVPAQVSGGARAGNRINKKLRAADAPLTPHR